MSQELTVPDIDGTPVGVGDAVVLVNAGSYQRWYTPGETYRIWRVTAQGYGAPFVNLDGSSDEHPHGMLSSRVRKAPTPSGSFADLLAATLG